jgi:hypothetical protein
VPAVGWALISYRWSLVQCNEAHPVRADPGQEGSMSDRIVRYRFVDGLSGDLIVVYDEAGQ